ncbi:MAG: hypothetical protein P4M13_06790 [Alphaproteobacteria bacterium]|jgi:hypothetical protein|nr:hypothetical protein [Alphaproteobacteria bacterium]
MNRQPLTRDTLSKLNHALVAAGFSSIDIDEALQRNVLIERAERRESDTLTSFVCLNPDFAHISFKFGDIKKSGETFRYPTTNADSEAVANFVHNLVGAATTLT